MYFKLALGNVKKSFRDYGIYFITLVFGVCVFYAFNSITEQQAVLELGENQLHIMELLGSLISGVSVFIAVVLGFLIVYASRYLIRRRKKEFGTYLTLGMPAGKVSRIIVYESLLVGLVSLVVGLGLGVAVSQLLLYMSAAMFSITVEHFVFVFSAAAMIKTVIYFGVIFLITLLFNVITITRYKLIDLINANRKNEGVKLRSLPLSVALFLISLVMIGVAYCLLIDNGLVMLDTQFGLSTLLVCVGTALFFFSLSGFLLRAVQSSKKLYFRGLNMFTLRQINSKINTTFISISIVCMALFLAITSTCGGVAIASSFNTDLANNTRFDATMRAHYGEGADKTATEPAVVQLEDGSSYVDEKVELAHADNFDMLSAFKRDVSNWDELVKNASQLDIYETNITFNDIVAKGNIKLKGIASTMLEEDGDVPIDATSISEFNEQRTLLGLEPVSLAQDEYLIWCDFPAVQSYYRDYLRKSMDLEIFGVTLKPATNELETMPIQTTAQASNLGTIVVPDEVLPANAPLTMSYLNVMYNGERADIEPQFLAALRDSYPERYLGTADAVNNGWPWMFETTAVQMIDQASGLTTMITYLAIYIGFILLIACAAILSLQQLSEAADNVARYHLLEELGVDRRMSGHALLVQIAIYFLFPLAVAVCHSIVALTVVVDVTAIFGTINIGVPLVITVGIFLVLYGIYFLVTYFASRTMVQAKGV